MFVVSTVGRASGWHRCLRDEDHGKTWGRRVGDLQCERRPKGERKMWFGIGVLKSPLEFPLQLGVTRATYNSLFEVSNSIWDLNTLELDMVLLMNFPLLQCNKTCIFEATPFLRGQFVKLWSVWIKSTRKWSQCSKHPARSSFRHPKTHSKTNGRRFFWRKILLGEFSFRLSYKPLKISGWNIIMEVWFISSSFLNGWFVGEPCYSSRVYHLCLSPIIMVQWKITQSERVQLQLETSHFPLLPMIMGRSGYEQLWSRI